MADRDFALPVGHTTGVVSTLIVEIGKPFLQPVDVPDYDMNYSSGLEIWLQDIEEEKRLYASFNGTIRYVASNNNVPQYY